jgi:hypothetical protein
VYHRGKDTFRRAMKDRSGMRHGKLSFVLLGFTPLLVAACDPCGLALGCAQSPRAAVVGQILDDFTGHPMSGVRVEMRRQSGIGLDPDAIASTTGSDGLFRLESRALDAGDVSVTMTVTAPGYPSYDVPNVALRASVKTGEATVLAPWSSGRPSVAFVFELYRNGTNDERVANAFVEFRRTSGVAMFLGNNPVVKVTGTTDANGWVYLFHDVRADRAGDIIGDLVIQLPPPVDSAFVRGVSIPALPVFRPVDSGARVGVGPD